MQSEQNRWTERAAQAFEQYDESLLRSIAAKLIRPRNQWPVEELRQRMLDGLSNAPVIDRRLKELGEWSRMYLEWAGQWRIERWSVHLLLLLMQCRGATRYYDDLYELFDAGLAFPVIDSLNKPLQSWEEWLVASSSNLQIEISPIAAERAWKSRTVEESAASAREHQRSGKVIRSDGMEWLLRLAVIWQQISASPLRVTQGGIPFKRDLTRLENDEILSAAIPEMPSTAPDLGILSLEMAIRLKLVVQQETTLLPATYHLGAGTEPLEEYRKLLHALVSLDTWHPLEGLCPQKCMLNVILLQSLARLSVHEEAISVDSIVEGFSLKPTGFTEQGIEVVLNTIAVPMNFVEAIQDDVWRYRATPLLRFLLGSGPAPDPLPAYPQCLIVQPNNDLIVYRQGLTPELIHRLTLFANWKMIGPACTLALTAESIYRGLEAGLSLNDILSTLRKHSAQELPANVLDLIRRWSAKRERINLYGSATLLEFNTAEELETAFGRGLVSMKIAERIGLVEGEVDFRHFRQIGNRDYDIKPQRCLSFEEDGVQFVVDMAGSDLLLEAELVRIAEPIPTTNGVRRFQITPASMQRARDSGLSLPDLEAWYFTRSGEELSASARLLYGGSNGLAGSVARMMVVQFPTALVTDGICQWPETASFVLQRLGPAAIAIDPERLRDLLDAMATVQVSITMG